MLKPATVLIALSTGAVAATFGLGFLYPQGPFHSTLTSPSIRSAIVRSPQFVIPAINERTSAPTRTDLRLLIEVSNPNKSMEVCRNAPRIQDYLLHRFTQKPVQINSLSRSVNSLIPKESVEKGVARILGENLVTRVIIIYQKDKSASSLLPKSDFVPCPEGMIPMPLLKS